jgi:hypothetical protein
MKFAAVVGAELQRLGPAGGSPGPEQLQPLAPTRDVQESPRPSYLQAPATAPPEIVDPIAVRAAAVPAPASPLAGTANVDMSAIVAAVKRGAVPFREAAPTPPVGETPARVADAQPRPRGPGTGTVMDMSDAVASACAAMPFSRAEGPPPKSPQEVDLEALPLETFAALSAALARGESREGVLAKHGLTASAFDAIAAAWGRRLQREPNMLARFNELATRAVKPAPATLMLSLEQHASLHVELAQHPARKDAILQRYNITPEQQAWAFG